MKNRLLKLVDKILLRNKRSGIETSNEQLKNLCQVEHSRHRDERLTCSAPYPLLTLSNSREESIISHVDLA